MRAPVPLVVSLLLFSLIPGGAGANESPVVFPDNFQFGTAVAGFQVDMGCPTLPKAVCDDDNSDWFQYVTSRETVNDWRCFLSGDDPSEVGPGQWELYASDIALADRELNNNAFRFSLEWSRIFPVATDGVEDFQALRDMADQDALEHYHSMLAALRARGMTPFVTINHYTLPLWIHDGVACHEDIQSCEPAGWVDKDRTVAEIAKFAGFVAQEFGAQVDQWATLNEPLAVLLPGFLVPSPDRSNPPAVFFSHAEARVVFNALVEAHARMYDAVKAGDRWDSDGDGEASQVGVVYAMAPVQPLDPEDRLDREAARNVFYLWNMAYLNAVALGELDDDLDGTAEYRPELADRMDFIGINYYTRITVSGLRFPIMPRFSELTTFNPLNMVGWEDYPEGIYEMALTAWLDLGQPSIISETGTWVEDDESYQSAYLVRRLAWVGQAIADGIPVTGYYYWSLVDNFEWNHGLGLKFGLYGYDPEDPSKARVPREAAGVYGDIARAGLIPSSTLDTYFGGVW